MGVIYKLKPEIKNFIQEKKQANRDLSCRGLASLVEEKFKIKLSKSSINSLIKQAGLSAPIGRRAKKRRRTLEVKGSGAILLKAVDYLIGGSSYITEAIKNRLKTQVSELLAKTEFLIYSPLFDISSNTQLNPDSGIWLLINQRFNPEVIFSYLNELQTVIGLPLDIFRTISSLLREVRFLTFSLADGTIIYLDGHMYTVWSTPQIPYDFSSTIYKSKGYINKHFNNDLFLILFTAPGYDIATKEFFDFLLIQDNPKKKLVKIALYGNKMEELDTIRFIDYHKIYYVFGLWPWQFERYRKVKLKSEFNLFYFEPLQADSYLAEAEVELTQPKINQSVTLRGCVLKTSLDGKTKLIIATNIPEDKLSLEEIASYYLGRWPEPEKSFADFSHKIELFTYTADSRKVFSTESLAPEAKDSLDIKGALGYYLRCLDLFLRWHILPSEYQELDFSTTKQRFYSLRAKLRSKKDYQLVSFSVPEDYPFQKDLAYACWRLNEQDIVLPDKKRLWFNIG